MPRLSFLMGLLPVTLVGIAVLVDPTLGQSNSPTTPSASRKREASQSPSRRGIKKRSASMQGQVIWTLERRERAGTERYVFLLDPVVGLTDMDFHPVTDSGWQHMKSPNDTTTASLLVAPQTTMQEVERALGVLLSRGKYKSVEITIHTPS